jgi:hypothetical protein
LSTFHFYRLEFNAFVICCRNLVVVFFLFFFFAIVVLVSFFTLRGVASMVETELNTIDVCRLCLSSNTIG